MCPITQDIMTDPVTTICGHSFEREAITTWFRARSTCPCDNTHLASKHLSPNFALKHAIETYVQHRPLLAMKQQHETDFALAVQLREEFLQTQQEKRPPLSSSSASSSSVAFSSSSCPPNLTDLLSMLGLSQYNKNFQDAHVDFELLEGLDDGEWIEVFHACQVPIGARMKIKKSIRDRKSSTSANTNDTQREVKVVGPTSKLHLHLLLLFSPSHSHSLALNLTSTPSLSFSFPLLLPLLLPLKRKRDKEKGRGKGKRR
jgi:hypothetical protein